MLPKSITCFFYRILGRDVEYLSQLLNLQTLSYHRNIASRYFFEITNVASERLRNFSEEDLRRYKGNKKVRKAVDMLVKQKLFGPVAMPVLSNLAIADLIMKKVGSGVHDS